MTFRPALPLASAAVLSMGLAGCGHGAEQRASTGAIAGAVVAGPVGAAVGAAAGTVISKADAPKPRKRRR